MSCPHPSTNHVHVDSYYFAPSQVAKHICYLYDCCLSSCTGFPQNLENLELSGNFVKLEVMEKSWNLRYGQGIFL